MKYVDLFKLENCLSDNLASCYHEEIEEETTYKKAFGVVGSYENEKAKGLFIVVLCEDEAEAIYLWNAINNRGIVFEEDNSMLKTIDENGNYKLILQVNEY